MRLYAQVDLNDVNVIRFMNLSEELFVGDIIVLEPNYKIPLVIIKDFVIQPKVSYWYNEGHLSDNLIQYVNSEQFSGFDFIFKSTYGKVLTVESHIKNLVKKDLDITYPNYYYNRDVFYPFYENLYGKGKDMIFGKYNGHVIDIGAHAGGYTAGALKFGHKNIISIEPTPILAKTLRKLFIDFDEVTVLEGVVSNKNNDKLKFSTEVIHNISVSNRIQETGNLVVSNYTLPQIIKDYNITEIALLKIDIEGEEYELIPSIPEYIYNMTHSIHLETHLMHGGDDSSLISYLQNKGFSYNLLRDDSEKYKIKEYYFYK
jgi:FkbM family methyltransferase